MRDFVGLALEKVQATMDTVCLCSGGMWNGGCEGCLCIVLGSESSLKRAVLPFQAKRESNVRIFSNVGAASLDNSIRRTVGQERLDGGNHVRKENTEHSHRHLNRFDT